MIIIYIFIILLNILLIFINIKTRKNNRKFFISSFIIPILVGKGLTFYIEKYETIDKLILKNFFITKLEFIFYKGENLILKEFENIINVSQSLEIYIGIISILIAVYIYCVSLEDDFKKYVLVILLGEGKVLYLTVFILIFYYLNITPVFFSGLILIVFYELYKIIKYIFLITNNVEFRENFGTKDFLKLFGKGENEEILKNLYYELRKRIFKAMLEKDSIRFEESVFFYKILLESNNFLIPDSYIINSKEKKYNRMEKIEEKELEKIPKSLNEVSEKGKTPYFYEKVEQIGKEEQVEAVKLLYSIYNYLIENPDQNTFDAISYLNIELGNYYLKNNKFSEAKHFYGLLNLKYKYLFSSEENMSIENKYLHLFGGLRYYESQFSNEEQEIIILKSILDLFMELLKSGKYNELKEYIIILGSEYSTKKNILKEYLKIVLIYFINEYTKNEEDKKDEKNSLKQQLENSYLMNGIQLLEEVYTESKKRNLEEKFKISDYCLSEMNILGQLSGSMNPDCIRNQILKMLNENMVYFIDEKFILENIEDVERKIEILKLTKLKKRMEELLPKIKIEKAKKISLIQLTSKEIEEYYNSIIEEETSFFKFIKEEMKIKISVSTLEKNEEWEKEFKGYKYIYQNDIILDNYMSLIYVDSLNEYCFMDKIKGKQKNIENINELSNSDEYFIISKRTSRKLLKNLNNPVHFLQNYNLEGILLINKNSIKEIIFYLPYGYTRKKYTYLDIEPLKDNTDKRILEKIEGDTEEEKELIKQGSSLLKIAKKMEIIFNEKTEIYNIKEKV